MAGKERKRTPEQIQKRNEKSRLWRASLTPEKKDELRKRISDWKKENRSRVLEHGRNRKQSWSKEHPDAYKKYQREYRSSRINSDPLFRLRTRMSSAIGLVLKTRGLKRNARTTAILGCSIEHFRSYLESKFESWMTWDNYGKYDGSPNTGWDLDHIIPISVAESEIEIMCLSYYTNFQPLCSYTNRCVKRDLS